MRNWYLIYGYALGMSAVVSMLLTALARRLAIRWGILDHPGERKMQKEPMPLLGGVAIWVTFNLMVFVHLPLIEPVRRLGFDWLEVNVLGFLGENTTRKLFGIFLGGAVIFILGVIDDLRSLKPEIKLVGQVFAGIILVYSGVRLDLFIPDTLEGSLSTWVSGAVTVLWIVMMTNSMNFLDNMDGLCGGVSLIAALSFFLCVFPHQEYFVCVLLMAFAGSTVGFLYHNLSPAKIFMGDAGAMFCGYLLATMAVLGTFYTATTPSRVAVAAPIIALSVPLFDTLSVVYIRLRNGDSIMKGDKRHFSHRLVELGMTPRQAVEFIFLVAAVNGLGAALLPQVGMWGTLVILGQTAGVFSLIVLLMNAGNNKHGGKVS